MLRQHSIILNYAGSGSFKFRDRWFLVREGEFARPLSNGGGSVGTNICHAENQPKTPLSEVVTSSKDKIKLNKGMPKFKQQSH